VLLTLRETSPPSYLRKHEFPSAKQCRDSEEHLENKHHAENDADDHHSDVSPVLVNGHGDENAPRNETNACDGAAQHHVV